MNLDLSEEKAAALTADITGNDRYPFSERIRALKAIPHEARAGSLSATLAIAPGLRAAASHGR